MAGDYLCPCGCGGWNGCVKPKEPGRYGPPALPGLLESSLRAELEAYKRAYLDFQRRHSALLQIVPGVAKMAELMKSYDVDKLDDLAKVEVAVACQDAAEDAARMYFWVRDNEPRALLDKDKEPV